MTNISIILPCYNESKNLHHIFQSINEILASRNDLEIILVDNGSTDNSLELLQEFENSLNSENFKVISINKNIGYGHGIMTGLKNANGSVLAWTHADLQTDIFDVCNAYDHFISHNKNQYFLKGKRVNRSFLDSFFTFGMSMFASLLLKKKLFDINAQPKMFYRDFYLSLSKAPDDFSLDLYVLYESQVKGLKLIEYPVFFGKRKYGLAKGGGSFRGKVRLSIRTLKYIFKLRRYLAQ